MSAVRLAIISNEQTPYRIHLHRRIVAECPGIRLFSVFTHEVSSSPWRYREIAAIQPVMFGKGESSGSQSSLFRMHREWRKGGQITEWLEGNSIQAVVLSGYNDPGRLRILRWCRRRGIPCFLFGDSNARCDMARGVRSLLKRMVVERVVADCAGILHCGSLGREYFLRYGAQAERLFPFPYEPEYESFLSPDQGRVEAVRERYGIDAEGRHLLYSGRLVGVKRVDLLLAAFERIAATRPSWKLIIAGSGPLESELKSRAPSALRDRIIWTGFFEDPSELAALYHCADVLVIPSDYEPWGVVVTEAAAAGMAVVASLIVGAAADVVDEGVNGHIFERGDVADLTRCLLAVTDPDATDVLRSRARGVLARWRRANDPVQGLCRALASVGLQTTVPAGSEVPV